ncbi:PilN domain-containing protein [Massilia oculi]|jgi:type IV pilus assembly protein PilN|uniref:Fimbrial assembly protein n=1 Tax=Massilia oculi TaxID=945844 RepID=A0A2S2DI56_9BURK|nr:PilN domain-containing protein [Massilia oculi]AWL05017.1 fimbrial assembly protein [Massilia oculi]
MIRINLLPHREAKRKQKQAAFVALLALGGVLGAIVVMLVGGYNASQISVQNQRNDVLKKASAELDKKIGEITNLKEEIAALQARQQAVEDLQGDRNQPVHLLDELVRQTPEGVHLKSVKQSGQRVILTGNAQSQERVAELLRNLSSGSAWLQNPDLTEVRAVSLTQGKTSRNVVEFTLGVSIKRARLSDEGEEAADGGKPAGTKRAAEKS